MRLLTVSIFVFLLAPSTLVFGDNWPHWRGPTGNSVAYNARPPLEFSNTKNVKWKVEVPGRGSASPVIWENQVFVSTAVPQKPNAGGQFGPTDYKLICYNRADGSVLWERVAATAVPHEGGHATNSFASASPCTDGEHVYAHFGSRGLFCYTMKGDPVWKRTDFGVMKTLNEFGEGSSPTIADDKIIVPWDHAGPSALYALNKYTGDTIWRVKRDGPTSWATPLIIDYEGQKQIIMNGQGVARSYDLASGKDLWHCAGFTKRPIASPVYMNGLAIIACGFQGTYIAAFRPNGHGDVKGTENEVWKIEKDGPDVASPLLTPTGRLYFHKGKNGPLSCVDAMTGKAHYMGKRIEGLNDAIYSSPVAAGGYIFMVGRQGTVVVIKDSDDLEIVSSNPMNETVDATIAPVDDELFIRGEKHLFCIAAGK